MHGVSLGLERRFELQPPISALALFADMSPTLQTVAKGHKRHRSRIAAESVGILNRKRAPAARTGHRGSRWTREFFDRRDAVNRRRKMTLLISNRSKGFLREGDVLMVTRIDRLARSIGDLQDIVRTVKARGASLRPPNSQSTRARQPASAFLDMLGVLAEFETNLRPRTAT